MNRIKNVLHSLIDALFPPSQEELELLDIDPIKAFEALPAAPKFDSSVVPLPNTRSLFAYKDPRVSRLIWNIKNKKDPHSLQIAGHSLFKALSEIPPSSRPIALIPIPITNRRRRERGFNQCELMIEEILKLDAQKRFVHIKDLLIRNRSAGEQKTKSRSDRLGSSWDIFSTQPHHLSKDSALIVIDDVITTGSTMKAALDALKSNGFKDVRGLSIAH